MFIFYHELYVLVTPLAHGDNFAAKRMRKLTQRRAVDYTSTVVRYMQFGPMPIDFVFITIQLLPTLSWLIQGLPELLGIRTNIGLKRMGELDPKTFHDTCKSRFPPDEAEIQATTLYSSWQENLKNPDWHPIFRRN
ncbi:factor of DNA methylation 5 isoform X1 [Gossypium raimondii]|uniref:factor of DNA methylation 5 isoform X1 n=1 Tax=Gossypium raimondii TaxID=29730 RepID=UPI00227A7A23|nr:factor of DNA methylation 5 isoform X1 [Gossypium raimondii]XP_052478916.1 factor of DNA methylation 5 isoform X1 [Gossypium raimondii]